LNVSGYEKCTFILVASGLSQIESTTDLFEAVIHSNQAKEYQLWVIASLQLRNNYNYISKNYTTENCSVMILIECVSFIGNNFTKLFRSRLHTNESSIFIIRREQSKCDLNVNTIKPMQANLYILYMTQNGNTLYNAVSICTTCSANFIFKSMSLPLPLGSIHELKAISKQIELKSMLPTIVILSFHVGIEISIETVKICAFLYRTQNVTLSQIIGCRVEHIIIQILATKMNLSIEFIYPKLGHAPKHAMQYISGKTPKHFAGTMNEILLWVETVHPIYQIKRTEILSRFLYCVKSDERLGFSYSFWILPYDLMSWLTIITLSLIYTVLRKGHWLEIFAILVRQSCSNSSSPKYLAFLTVGAIVFTCCYEEFISSFIIIKSSVVVFKNLKEIIDRNYSLVEIPVRMPFFAKVFKMENITSRTLNDSIIRNV